MGCCFSSPSKSHHNTSHVKARHERASRSMNAQTAAPAHADRTRTNCELVNRKPVPKQPLPVATHQNWQHLPQGQPRVGASYDATQALSAHTAGSSRSHGQDHGLKVTTVPYSGQPTEPGNVSPVSVDSISTHGGPRVHRMATTGRIRKKYKLPPKKTGIEMGADEAIRE